MERRAVGFAWITFNYFYSSNCHLGGRWEGRMLNRSVFRYYTWKVQRVFRRTIKSGCVWGLGVRPPVRMTLIVSLYVVKQIENRRWLYVHKSISKVTKGWIGNQYPIKKRWIEPKNCSNKTLHTIQLINTTHCIQFVPYKQNILKKQYI